MRLKLKFIPRAPHFITNYLFTLFYKKNTWLFLEIMMQKQLSLHIYVKDKIQGHIIPSAGVHKLVASR